MRARFCLLALVVIAGLAASVRGQACPAGDGTCQAGDVSEAAPLRMAEARAADAALARLEAAISATSRRGGLEGSSGSVEVPTWAFGATVALAAVGVLALGAIGATAVMAARDPAAAAPTYVRPPTHYELSERAAEAAAAAAAPRAAAQSVEPIPLATPRDADTAKEVARLLARLTESQDDTSRYQLSAEPSSTRFPLASEPSSARPPLASEPSSARVSSVDAELAAALAASKPSFDREAHAGTNSISRKASKEGVGAEPSRETPRIRAVMPGL